MASHDFYAILGVPRDVPRARIKRAYLLTAKKYHPDRNPEGGDRFREIGEAYRVLSDDNLRRIYDQSGEAGVRIHELREANAKATATANQEAAKKHAYGRAFGAKAAFRPNLDISALIGVSLNELYQGTERKLTVKRTNLGKTEKETISVYISPGRRDGDELCVKGAGHILNDTQVGDLVVVLQLAKHSHFECVNQLDLLYKHRIPLYHALCGDYTLVIEHLNGVVLTVVQPPSNEVSLSTGTRRIIKGHGMPNPDRPTQRGDLIIEFEVEFPAPDTLTAEVRQQLSALLPTRRRQGFRTSELDVNTDVVEEVTLDR
mmetsp:Transcript_10268/g.25805  ORF Transcript_10268/g.25805 Transcript_10268/m.25805 type:complete len:317 (+) Transcript_10268:1-951(+)